MVTRLGLRNKPHSNSICRDERAVFIAYFSLHFDVVEWLSIAATADRKSHRRKRDGEENPGERSKTSVHVKHGQFSCLRGQGPSRHSGNRK